MLDRLVSRIASLNPDASYRGGEVRIDLGGTHAEAVATVRQARRVLGL